ncbi:MAG: hypothetical protein JXA30_08970 [Deltaproteobacteria bacterium]|nr:hypothetical protein [Deltaproteobacteria bacterium]
MKDEWEKAKELTEKHASANGIFIRLSNHGDKVVGVFCGDPYSREVHWTGEKYEECKGEGCQYCGAGKRPSPRMMLNFFVVEESKMKVIEGNSTWFNDVLKVRDKYGLDKWVFEIERHGESGNPKTSYSILPEEKIDDALRTQIQTAELHDLENIGSEESSETVSEKPKAKGGLIDPRAAGELVAQLKAFPRSDVDAFLAEFGVQRVRDIRAADENKAREYIERMTAPQKSAEIDPFA